MNSREAFMEIRKAEKYVSLGGFIGEAVKDRVATLLHSVFGVPLYIPEKVFEYKEEVDMKELLDRMTRQYKEAETRNSWFRACQRSYGDKAHNYEFDKWYMDASLRLCVNAMKNSEYLDNTVLTDGCREVFEAVSFCSRMTWIECFVLAHRFDIEGKVAADAESIARLPELNCEAKYIEMIFKRFDVEIETFDEEDTKFLMELIHSGGCVELEYRSSEECFDDSDFSLIDTLSVEELVSLFVKFCDES